MMTELLEVTSTLEFEEFGSIRPIRFESEEETLKIILQVDIGDCKTIQTWELSCHSPHDYQLNIKSQIQIDVYDDHILLWPHTQPWCRLWFTGPKDDPAKLMGELWFRHYEIVGKWFPFPRFINNAQSLHSLIRDGYGLLAQGPETLILAYQEVIEKYGFKASYGSRAPRYWNGVQFQEEPVELFALVMGDIYVVTPHIEARRIS